MGLRVSRLADGSVSFFLLSHWNQTSRRGREGGGEGGKEGERREYEQGTEIVSKVPRCVPFEQLRSGDKGHCFDSLCLTPKLFSRLGSWEERSPLPAPVRTNTRLLANHFLSIPSWEPVVFSLLKCRH